MAIELNRQRGAPVSPLGGFRGVVPPGEQSTPVTLDNHVTLDYAADVIPHHYAFAVSDAEFEAAFGRIRAAGITYYADPGCRQAAVGAPS